MFVRVPSPQAGPQPPKRRAATALEYLFCTSLILCAAIIGIQAVGGAIKKSFTKSSETIEQLTPVK